MIAFLSAIALLFAIVSFVSIGHQAEWRWAQVGFYLAYEFQALIAGFLGLIGGLLAFVKISEQIRSTESLEMRRQLQAELAALIKIKNGAETWRRFFNENRARIDVDTDSLIAIPSPRTVRRLEDDVWKYRPVTFSVITDLLRPLRIEQQIALLDFQRETEATQQQFEFAHDPAGIGGITFDERTPILARQLRRAEDALSIVEQTYQGRLQEIAPDHSWDFVTVTPRQITMP